MSRATLDGPELHEAADDGHTHGAAAAPRAGRAEASSAPAAGAKAAPAAGRKRRPVLGIVLIAIVFALVAAATAYWLATGSTESTDDAFIEGHVIPIAPQVAARVADVRVDDNDLVRKGQTLVLLDPTDYQVALDVARATLVASRGKLEQAKADVTAAQAQKQEAEAQVAVAQANAANAQSDLDRYHQLAAQNDRAVSKQQLDSATMQQRSSAAQVQQARANVAAADAKIQTAQAAVAAAEGDVERSAAQVHSAEVNLSYCAIAAPEDGRVTRKSVEPGSYVTAGQSLLAIVSADVWVTANFKETQLDRLRPGDRVSVSVDAYPHRKLTGKVQSIQSGTGSRFSMLPPENATGNFVKVVQRVPVKIALDPGQNDDVNQPLAPGMSVEPAVDVRR